MKKVKELMRQIMSEPKSNGVQFSKVIVLICLGIMVIGIIAALVVATIFNLVEVPVALITACGAVGVTAVVWNLKKSQTENTVKIYTEAYKDMIKFKKEMGVEEDDLMNGIENGIVDKMNGSIEEALIDSTTLIEKQEVL